MTDKSNKNIEEIIEDTKDGENKEGKEVGTEQKHHTKPLPKDLKVNKKNEEFQPDENNLALEIDNLKKQVDHFRKQFQLALADKENIKRIMQKNVNDASDYSIVNFARDIVNSCDNLERALQNIPENDQLHKGVKLTWDELSNVLKRYNIERIDPLGQKFDHNFHQAISEVVDNEKDSGTILQVMQCGYTIKDRLLRPAIVVVSANKSEQK